MQFKTALKEIHNWEIHTLYQEPGRSREGAGGTILAPSGFILLPLALLGATVSLDRENCRIGDLYVGQLMLGHLP